MEFSLKNDGVIVTSEKKTIELMPSYVSVDGLSITSAGEYEKSGFLLYAYENEYRYYTLRAEGMWIGFMPEIPENLDTKVLDFFGQLDILVSPISKGQQKILEQLEPRMLISYSDMASELASILWVELSIQTAYKLRIQDIDSEKTFLIILQ